MIRIVWDGKLRRKTTAYRLCTKVISKLMSFIELKLQVDHFFNDSFVKFAEFWVFKTYIVLPNCECECLLNSLCCYQRWTEWSERFGRLSALTSKKRRRFILAYKSRPKFGRTFSTCLHKLLYKIISEWERHICLSKPKTVSDSFRWVCMVHLWTNYL